MEIIRPVATALTVLGLLCITDIAQAQHVHGDASNPESGASAKAGQYPQHSTSSDMRQLVTLPEQMRLHTLANMRDHLQTISEIQGAIATGKLDHAAAIAELRLGMTSLKLHGAHDLSKYMPQGMQDIGTTMHHNASQFALEIQNATATGDLKPALAALSRTTKACVACHAAYRFQ